MKRPQIAALAATQLAFVLTCASYAPADVLINTESAGYDRLEAGDTEGAVFAFEQALEAAGDDAREREGAVLGLAKATLLLGDHARSAALWKQLVDHGVAEAQTFDGLGLALYLSKDLAGAEKALRSAIEQWEEVRLGESDANNVTLFEQQAHTYRLLQRVLVDRGQTDAALEISEFGRARSLVALLSERAGNAPSRATPLSLAAIKAIARSHATTVVEYTVVGSEVRVLGNEPEEETDLFIWVVKPTGETFFRRVDLRAAGVDSLFDLVLRARESGLGVRGRGASVVADQGGAAGASNGSSADASATLRRLYTLLIEPVADLLPAEPGARVTFVPHKALFLVPFAALQDSAGKYLLEKLTPATASSIQMLEMTRKLREVHAAGSTGTQPALVVGNPRMPALAGAGASRREPLPQLPAAEAEAKAVASILATQPLIGVSATKSAVLKRMPGARIIHLATHGLLDIDAGLNELGEPIDKTARSARASNVRVTPGKVTVGKGVFVGDVPAAVALASEKVVRVEMPGAIALAGDNDDRGFLTAEEISGLDLDADLVVLSACDTGRGRITGDGVVGLARAFVGAGVPSVVMSLWAIPDAPTASLMSKFYENLDAGKDKAQALRAAMLDVAKDRPQPRDWAAFTLLGEP